MLPALFLSVKNSSLIKQDMKQSSDLGTLPDTDDDWNMIWTQKLQQTCDIHKTPPHQTDVPVCSKSLRGCAFEFAIYWNTSHGHICLPLPWRRRQNASQYTVDIETECAEVCVCLKDLRWRSPTVWGLCERDHEKINLALPGRHV